MPRQILAFLAGLTLSTLARATEADLEARIRALESHVEALHAEIDALKHSSSSDNNAKAVDTTPAGAVDTPPISRGDSANAGTATASGESTTFFGYGEAVYSRPTHNVGAAQADLRRVVFGFGHEFDERTRVTVEAEWEHAVTSASDAGEAAIEQAYIERDLGTGLRFQAGLFLIPLGILNERHEPPTFYGVDRNLVETAIIPSTWREGGVALSGNTAFGLDWSAGVTTGFDLTKWDANSTDAAESPLRSIHQELQLAKAGDLSVFGAAKYLGVPGLALGAGVFTGKVGQRQDNVPLRDSRATVWNVYARWAPAAWEFTALYARGAISNTRDFNLSLLGNATLVPAAFWGGYAEAAYRGFAGPTWAIEPFVRYERVNTGSRYADLGAGLTPAVRPTETVTTVGATLRLHPNVVLKIDYQDFRQNADGGRFNIGMGYLY
jgi:hypothetical protein